ncbi:universal stress protein [Ulvibacterium sp.]|uniref:universal stress protein n=1 Tax=Ulvibacterium sp. TaxID=2665914 RepID=UPI003BACFBC6
MKKILLPTDFSKNSKRAMDFATSLFAKEDCKFYVLHAYQKTTSVERGESASQQKLQNLISGLNGRKNRNHRFEAIFMHEIPVNAINVSIIDKDVDFMVMGTKGATALAKIFMGSTAVSVLRHINNCPIIVVPENYDERPIEEIVFVNDFKHLFRMEELYPLKYLVKIRNAMLIIVRFNTSEALKDQQKLNRELLKNNLAQVPHHFKTVPLEASVSSSINNLLEQHKGVGIVALLKSKHSFLEKLLWEPVIRNVAFTTKVPLLVLPNFD